MASYHSGFVRSGFVRSGRSLVMAMLLVFPGATLFAQTGGAARSPARGDAQYQADVVRCQELAAKVDEQACLREAAAALEIRKRDGTANGSGSNNSDAEQYRRNALARCELQPASAREDCRQRVLDPSVTQGSVIDGGTLTETITREVARPPVVNVPAGSNGAQGAAGTPPSPSAPPALSVPR